MAGHSALLVKTHVAMGDKLPAAPHRHVELDSAALAFYKHDALN